MKLFRFLVPSLLLAGHVPAQEGVPLVREGQPVAEIYVPTFVPPDKVQKDLAIDAVGLAAEDFAYHLKKMSGAEVAIRRVGSTGEITGLGLVLGKLAEELGVKPDPTPYENSIRIVTRGDRILAVGGSDEATSDAVYTLLRMLGCDWVMPGEIGEVVPRRETVVVPELDHRETPSFAYRNVGYRGGTRINTPEDYAEFARWKIRQRMSDGRGAFGQVTRFPLLPPLGAGHVWDILIRKHPEAFEADPTMLALVRDPEGNLVRRGPQIESTHPGIVDLIVGDIRDKFEKEGWAKDRPAAFSIGPADGLGYSISTESQLAGSGRTDPIVGDEDVTDLVVLLGNEIFEKIGTEFPNVSLGFYSYSTHADYPLRYEPHPRLQQIFAPINFSRFHGVFDKNSKTQPLYKRVVEQWGKQAREHGNALVYRGYNWNLAENMVPYSRLRIQGEHLPWYHENGFLGVTLEATKAWAVNGPHDYLLARLLWDVTQDWNMVFEEYCSNAFGAGAAPMAEYFRLLTDRQHAAGQEAGSYHALHLMYDQEFVEQGRKLIQKAISLAKTDAERERAGHFLYPLRALETYLDYFKAAGEFDFGQASEHFGKLYEIWNEAYEKNTQIVAREVPQYLDRFLKKFVEEGKKYSSEPYRIVYRIPDRLKTMLDPQNVGDQLNFASPALNDDHYFETRTWSAPWDAQGLGAYRNGAVWYRIPFELPDLAEGEFPGLFLGGVEDEASVWLNGEFLGRSGRMFSAPFLFDLSEFAKPDGENLLVLKVFRNSAANEIGLGGLLRPSFVFAGPRIDPPVPSSGQPRHRVLPGGEIDERNTE